jgi:hypothetical protein
MRRKEILTLRSATHIVAIVFPDVAELGSRTSGVFQRSEETRSEETWTAARQAT